MNVKPFYIIHFDDIGRLNKFIVIYEYVFIVKFRNCCMFENRSMATLKHFVFLIAVTAILTGSSGLLFSQPGSDTLRMHFNHLSIKDGLSQGMVQCIIQDKEGYMWFASKDGLNKYDGYRFTVYRNNPADSFSLPDNYVTKMLEDDYGNFWIGLSFKGICLFDKKSEKFYSVPASLLLQRQNESIQK
ncbi:MAG: hypothetical protein IPM91_09750 [Bacteroidetes bacterium]|nr:hypothetical protein [Bacteroidota bacterium]